MVFDRTLKLLISVGFAASVFRPLAALAGDREASAVLLLIHDSPRQTFAGLGASVGNWDGDYQQLTPAQRETLSRLLWENLSFKIVRLWMNTDEFAPTPGAHDLATFRRRYVDSNIIADARRQGVTTLLLAPDKFPGYMQERRGNETFLKEAQVDAYAVLLADFIRLLKTDAGTTLDATGIQNEPNILDQISAQQMPRIVKRLRAELDAHGCSSVKIIAPEAASNDDTFYRYIDALKADPDAWRALAGISSHSYNMAATRQVADRLQSPNGENAKEFWMTEASDNGPELRGDTRRAMSLTGRFLNDMNHRSTHWIHFLGFEKDDPKDNATRIIAYTAHPFATTLFQKYYSYQQLARAFDVGAVFRQTTSDLEGDMTWTFGQKPRITAAAAKNPDGTWALAIVNYTSDTFAGVQGWSDEKWNQQQGGHTPAQTLEVTVHIPALEKIPAVPMLLTRSRPIGPPNKPEPTEIHHGHATLTIHPLELITLRQPRTPPAPATQD